MKTSRRTFIPYQINGKPISKPRSLCWIGNELIDWAGGYTRHCLDGTVHGARVRIAFSFDCASSSNCGTYVVVFQRLGTKGILLRNGTIVREINRSHYHAEAYEYPIAFLELPNRRTALIHCPENYCRLEIEDTESGERLTHRDSELEDFFHSRLAVSPDSRYFVSAGRRWHPLDDVIVFGVDESLRDPMNLDHCDNHRLAQYGNGIEVRSAAFQENGNLLVATGDEADNPNYRDEDDKHLLGPDMIGIYDISCKRFISIARAQEPLGTMMPVGQQHVIGFYKHPKLMDLCTGKIEMHWPDLDSGAQLSSIVSLQALPPPTAMDPSNQRFAVAGDDGIAVIQLEDATQAS